MKLSIAMATYNGAAYLRPQLESFAAQTRLPDELVVCDDGSTDDTPAILERFAASAPFTVRIQHNAQNLGLNGNFAEAIGLATGDVILISDQDDIWYPEKIEAVEAALSAHPSAYALVHDEHILGSDGRQLPGTLLGKVRQVGYSDAYLVAGNCTAHRRELLPLLLPIPPGDNYDGWIALVENRLGVRRVLDRPLQLYRRHCDNTSEPDVVQASPSLWSVTRRFGLADARDGWATTIAMLDELARRLRSQRLLVEQLIGARRAGAVLEQIEGEKNRLAARSRLLSKPRWRRWPEVTRLWAIGFYRSFSGAKSAVKDVLRP